MSREAIAPKDPGFVWSPRSCMIHETDLCPKVPDDFAKAHAEAIDEKYDWPESDDDVARVEEREDEIWYDDWLEDFGDYLEYDDVEARPEDFGLNEEDDPEYGRDPLDNGDVHSDNCEPYPISEFDYYDDCEYP